MKTKKNGIWFAVLALSCIIVVVSCNSPASKDDINVKGDKIIIGYFLKGGNVELAIPFEEAVSIATKYNQHIEKEYNYNYTEVWIETLVNADYTTNYYLASRADVTDKDGNKPISCYTTYFSLEKNEVDLLLAPQGETYTCTGHCCKSCKLTPAVPPYTGPSCECEQSNTECGPAWCDQTVTQTMGGGTN